jgi:MFS family permease
VRDGAALPTMVVGMLVGGAGMLCLAFSQSAWMVVLGIAVFAIGEMTAHPKYYSFIGLVAPADRKAVYMGYSFLYGVIGSLIGSSVGGALYERLLKPAIGAPNAAAQARLFWFVFIGIAVLGAAGLVLFHRFFGPDTPATRRAARRVMFGVDAAFLLLGGLFLWFAFQASPPQYRTAVQACIFLLLGAGGLAINLRRRPVVA